MDGWPVWLASLSIRDRHGKIVPTGTWSAERMAASQASIDTLLDGLGSPEHERSFRMCVTLCRHRALTADEADMLPDEWWTEPARDLAGGPVEVLWSRGVPETLSTQPCSNPVKVPLSPGLFFPQDCGACPSCEARKACRSRLPVRPPRPQHGGGGTAENMPPGGPWTSHGHPVPGVTVAGSGRPPVARCGGPAICAQCALDAERLRSDSKDAR